MAARAVSRRGSDELWQRLLGGPTHGTDRRGRGVMLTSPKELPPEQLAGFAIDECEAEIGGALTQAANDALAVLGVVRSRARIMVDEPILERAVGENRELAGRGGDGFGLAHPAGQAS
jgi:hypothetical protein